MTLANRIMVLGIYGLGGFIAVVYYPLKSLCLHLVPFLW